MDLAFDVFFCDLERPEAILNNDDAFDKSGEILRARPERPKFSIIMAKILWQKFLR